MKAWSYCVFREAVHTLLSFRKSERWQLIVALDRIRDQPFGPHDEEIQDVSGRWLYLRSVGPFVITYAEDFPVRRLEILALRKQRPFRWLFHFTA